MRTLQRNILVMIIGLGLCLDVVAQHKPDYLNTYETSNGYWTLHTDYASRHTTIKFYTTTDELLYQEVLAGQYVKLTKKNIRLFNEMLARLNKQDLVASTVKPTSLIADYTYIPERQSLAVARVKKADQGVQEASEAKSLIVNTVFLNVSEKLQVLFHNSKAQKIKVVLKNEANQIIYQEYSSLVKYNRSFDFSELKVGLYYLLVTGAGETYTQKLTVSYLPTGKQVIKIDNTSFLIDKVAKTFESDLLE